MHKKRFFYYSVFSVIFGGSSKSKKKDALYISYVTFVHLCPRLGRQSSNFLPMFCINKIIRSHLPAGIYLLKVSIRNTRTRSEICSESTIKTPERRHWRRSGVFIVNFEHISHLVLVFLLITLSS